MHGRLNERDADCWRMIAEFDWVSVDTGTGNQSTCPGVLSDGVTGDLLRTGGRQ